MAEPLEKPPTEDKPKVEFNIEELMDVAGAEEALAAQPTGEQEDELVQKLKGDEEKQPAEKPEEEQKEPEQDKPEPERKEPDKQPAQEAKSKKEEALEEQLKFYKMLYGDETERQQYQPEPQQRVQPQQTQQPEVQQPRSILDNIVVNKEELYDFLSGEPERALPVLRKFLGTAIILAQQNMRMEQDQVRKQTTYIDAVQKTFYQKFTDLNDFRPIVKMAGDQIASEYAARGINKYPHEIIDEIGKRSRELLQKLTTYKAQQPPKRVIPKQGEHSGTKPAPPVQDKRDEQQKHMDDLMMDT